MEVKNGGKIQEIFYLMNFNPDGNTLVITGCSKKKEPIDSAFYIKAKDLYVGVLFNKVRKYAEINNFDYIIISAKYGILCPDDCIRTYEKVLNSKREAKILRSIIEEELKSVIKDYDTILVIMGGYYRETLLNIVDDRFIFLKTKGIGEYLHVINQVLNS